MCGLDRRTSAHERPRAKTNAGVRFAALGERGKHAVNADQRGYGGGSFSTAQNMPRSLMAAMKSSNATGFTT